MKIAKKIVNRLLFYPHHFSIHKSLKTSNHNVPKNITLELTYACNASCVFCDRWKAPKEKQLKKDDWIKVIESFRLLGIKNINLSGGEPLLFPGIMDLISKCNELDIRVAINTNGIILSDFIKNLGNREISGIMVSIDSSIPEEHDKTRRNPGAWEKAIAGAISSQKKGINTSIGAVLTKANYNDIDNYIKLAKKINVGFRFQPIINCKDAHFNVDSSLLFSKEEFLELKKNLNLLFKENKKSWTDPIFYKLTPLFLTNPSSFLNIKCPVAARTLFVIDPKGDVYPCFANRKHLLGNITNKSFTEIIKSKETTETRDFLYSDKRDCVCWLRCMHNETIEYQFPFIFNKKKIKKMWVKKIHDMERAISFL